MANPLPFSISHLNCAKKNECLDFLSDYCKNSACTTHIISLNEPNANQKDLVTKHSSFELIYSPNQTNIRAAIAICGFVEYAFRSELSDSNFAVALIQPRNAPTFQMISAYLPNRIDLDFATTLDQLEYILNNLDNSLPIVICADTNSHNTVWNSITTNTRGEMLFDFIISNDLIIRNSFSTPTFIGHNGSSLIDIIFTNSHDLFHNSKCINSSDSTFSDHTHLILTDINFEMSASNTEYDKSFFVTHRYNTKGDIPWKKFQEELRINKITFLANCDYTCGSILTKFKPRKGASKPYDQMPESVSGTPITRMYKT